MVKLGTESSTYSESVVLSKGYETLNAGGAKTTVVNAQAGDSVIDDSAKDMAKIKGPKAKTSAEVDLTAKGARASIVILAQGIPTGTVPGKVYAK